MTKRSLVQLSQHQPQERQESRERRERLQVWVQALTQAQTHPLLLLMGPMQAQTLLERTVPQTHRATILAFLTRTLQPTEPEMLLTPMEERMALALAPTVTPHRSLAIMASWQRLMAELTALQAAILTHPMAEQTLALHLTSQSLCEFSKSSASV